MTRTRKITRRALLVAGTVVAMAGPFAPGLGSSDAHTCAYVRVTTTSVGSCHAPPGGPNDDCVWVGDSSGPAYVLMCVELPVAL
jgi:hypothetical protein